MSSRIILTSARVSNMSLSISNYKYCLLTRQQGEQVLLQINDNRRPYM